PAKSKGYFKDSLVHHLRKWAILYALMFPTLVSMVVFSYYPKFDVFLMSAFRWQPPLIQEYVGLRNFRDTMSDPLFWQSFRLVLILLAANLLKMWPCIFAAIALHRLINEKARYVYQVLFVIPMVIPSLVWLLIWKSFYDPDFGILNRLLNITGTMGVLHFLDGTQDAPGLMPTIYSNLQPFITGVLSPIFGSNGIWGLTIVGAMLFAAFSVAQNSNAYGKTQNASIIIIVSSLIPIISFYLASATGNPSLVYFSATISFIVLMVFLAKISDAAWLTWAAILLPSIFLMREELWRLPLYTVLALALGRYTVRRKEHEITADRFVMIPVYAIFLAAGLLYFFGGIWKNPTEQFMGGSPAWLGNESLILPSIIFWGFPWVGTVGVLIYLSGLQQISQDVYEASELDGVGPIGRLFWIELPLIMTQVRINLIFMTIGTLVQYEFFLILLEAEGGPGNKGLVPGLYMYKKAFLDGRFGYACALGFIMFLIILGLTIVYNKYVKVDK
ncbi:MAG: ABC transporter permease subunit, partial [Verrucomicrobiota bacterium]